MGEKKKKRAFWEIEMGRCGLRMQSECEQAQIIARERGCKVTATLKITFLPPEVDDEHFGGAIYSASHAAPPQVSRIITTELDETGIVIDDGEDISSLLQTALELPEVNFKKGEEKNG